MPGVSIVFSGKVILGTRAQKTHSKSFQAFSSINYPYLGVLRDGVLLSYIHPRHALLASQDAAQLLPAGHPPDPAGAGAPPRGAAPAALIVQIPRSLAPGDFSFPPFSPRETDPRWKQIRSPAQTHRPVGTGPPTPGAGIPGILPAIQWPSADLHPSDPAARTMEG